MNVLPASMAANLLRNLRVQNQTSSFISGHHLQKPTFSGSTPTQTPGEECKQGETGAETTQESAPAFLDVIRAYQSRNTQPDVSTRSQSCRGKTESQAAELILLLKAKVGLKSANLPLPSCSGKHRRQQKNDTGAY